MMTLDEFLKTDRQKLEEDCEKILAILKMNDGSVAVQGARWQRAIEDGVAKWHPDSQVSEYFGLDPSRLHNAMLLLRKKGLLRYRHIDNSSTTGRSYFRLILTPSYKRVLACEISV
jgi:hypothetical protein